MENTLLVINIILAAILVVLVLIQKSEGGALGIGISQDNFMFSRSAGNFLTKSTIGVFLALISLVLLTDFLLLVGNPAFIKTSNSGLYVNSE